MANRALTKAYKEWLAALDRMRAAIAANPLVADPLMASAQVFEDIGRMVFGSGDKPKRKGARAKRAKAKRAAPRKTKKTSARAKRKSKR